MLMKKYRIKNLIINTTALVSMPVIYALGANISREQNSPMLFIGTTVLSIVVPCTVVKMKKM